MPPTMEQLQEQQRLLGIQARVNADDILLLWTATRNNSRKINALLGGGCAITLAECRALVDYLDGCLIAEAHQPAEIVAIRDRALAATRRVDRPDEPEDTP